MNNCSFSGRIYKFKDNGKSGKDANVNFRIGFRKPFVSDADDKAGKTMHFAGINAWGSSAEFVGKYFKEGDNIEVACQYDPFEGTDGEVPSFRLVQASFVPKESTGGNGNSGGGRDNDRGSSRDNDRGSSRDNGRDNDRGSSRSSRNDEDSKPNDREERGSRRSRDDQEDDAPPRRGSRRGADEDAGGDSTPF